MRQTFNRRVLQSHLSAKNPLSLVFAIPDHPWVDSADGAAVRIAMTVAALGNNNGLLKSTIAERKNNLDDIDVLFEESRGKLQADLTIGANVTSAKTLQANQDLSNRGVSLFGKGFIVSSEDAKKLGLGKTPGLEKHIRHYQNGRDITQCSRNVMVIDLYGLSADESQTKFPETYNHILVNVKPERDQNRRKTRRENWWLFGETNPKLRDMLNGLPRYIVTVETSKHRFFVFLDQTVIPDNKLINFALDDAYFLGVLSSRVHVEWVLATGSTLGPTPVYVKTTGFEKFPFPAANETQKARIRELGETLDAHRKRQQSQHPKLTLTGMYNVLEKVRAEEALNAKEKIIHEQGLVSILKELHDNLDQAVFDAYGWDSTLSDEEILQHLVDLNAERAIEEAKGQVRWLRPEYQAPDEVQHQQATLMDVGVKSDTPSAPLEKENWPTALKDRATAVRSVLALFDNPGGEIEVASGFKGRRTKKRLDQIGEILEMLLALGQIREEDGKYMVG